MKLVISVDVEEEGLFSGTYTRRPPGVENVRRLNRLEFITRELGLPLTLLATYPVVRDPSCRDILMAWRDGYLAEIGAHLHPWNTPPFQDLPFAEPVASDLLPALLVREKLVTLRAAFYEHMGARPLVFRMGRFDLGRQVAALLPELGFRVDSSVVPLRRAAGGPDHFLAPSDPYLLNPPGCLGTERLSANGPETWLRRTAMPGALAQRMTDDRNKPVSLQARGLLLEVPLTQVGVFPVSPKAIYRLASKMRRKRCDFLLSAFRHVAVAGIQPAWFPLASMKLATRLHRRRGGKVLTMFLHSSELDPGATPSFRTEAAVNRLVAKIRSYLTWLLRTEQVRGVTLSGLYDSLSPCDLPIPHLRSCDLRSI